MGRSVLNLAQLTTDELARLSGELGLTLGAVFKVDKKRVARGIERQIATETERAWKGAVRDALTEPLRELLRKPVTAARLDNFLRKLGLGLKDPISPRQQKLLTSRLEAIYRIGKERGARDAGMRANFSLVDQRAVQAIGEHQVFWIGDFYSEHLSNRIQAVSRDVLLEQGLSHAEAGRVLRDTLSREFGLKPGGPTNAAPATPPGFAGKTDAYFKGVASTVAHQSQTFGRLRAFSDAGVIRYELVNPMDERTGEVCQHLNGQVFQVNVSVDHMNKLLAAKDPDEVRRIAPWHSGNEIKEILGDTARGSSEAYQALFRAGAMLPPFHNNCRTDIAIL